MVCGVVGMLMLATTVPAFADLAGPPGPPDTSELQNQDPPENVVGHDASCGAQGANLDRNAGASDTTPSNHALEFNHDEQCTP